MLAIILADGDAPTRLELDAAWPGWDDGVALVIAADGGARLAARLDLAIDLWVGDGDSLGDDELAALIASGIPAERAPHDKDESDTELAILAALRRQADGLVIVGALGGPRFDHAIANVALLSMPELAATPATIVDGRSRIGLIRAPGPDGSPVVRRLVGRPGDLVSLLPLGADAEGVTTTGLAYPLVNEPLLVGRTRGLSNVRDADVSTVTVGRGSLLVVESLLRSEP
jgi:thiamine pyrophosphokinase